MHSTVCKLSQTNLANSPLSNANIQSTTHTDSKGHDQTNAFTKTRRKRRTRQEVVELVNTRHDAQVDGLVAKVDDDTTEHGRVDLYVHDTSRSDTGGRERIPNGARTLFVIFSDFAC